MFFKKLNEVKFEFVAGKICPKKNSQKFYFKISPKLLRKKGFFDKKVTEILNILFRKNDLFFDMGSYNRRDMGSYNLDKI